MPMVPARFGRYLCRARDMALPAPDDINRRAAFNCERLFSLMFFVKSISAWAFPFEISNLFRGGK
jgi:hypothetical protein